MDPDDGAVSVGVGPAHTIVLGSRQQSALVYSGLLFMLVSMACFFALIWWICRGLYPLANPRSFESVPGILSDYLPALILFASAIICAGVGYSLLNAAGAAGKEVIPRQDYALLSALVAEEKEKAIDLYVRLNSLSGFTGFFTKIGITGLPLATIVLTLIFASLGLSQGANPKFFDFANLTLGAFLGSYVQRQVSASTPNRKKGDYEES